MNNAFQITQDIPGRIRNTKLPTSHYLQPLFESITNSFDAIEDKGAISDGLVRVFLHRRKQLEIDTGDFSREPITAFEVEDNGIGFNEANYKSFLKADSTLKEDRGGKGVGRFIWLKAFKKVHINSFFKENGKRWQRQFIFSRTQDGIENYTKQLTDSDDLLLTKVFLDQFEEKYQKKCPIDASIIARRIIEHFLAGC